MNPFQPWWYPYGLVITYMIGFGFAFWIGYMCKCFDRYDAGFMDGYQRAMDTAKRIAKTVEELNELRKAQREGGDAA